MKIKKNSQFHKLLYILSVQKKKTGAPRDVP